MIKKTLLFALLFFVTGELMIKADKHFKVFESNRMVKIPMDHGPAAKASSKGQKKQSTDRLKLPSD